MVGLTGARPNGVTSSRSQLSRAALCAGALLALWFLRSSLLAVYGHLGDVTAIDGRWLAAVLGCETVAFVVMELARLALRTDRWFDVAVAQLTGNAASNVVPAGGPVGAAVQLRVMSEAGFELTRAATSMGALAVLGAVGLLALPVVALPLAMAAGTNLHGLAGVLSVGLGLLVALLVATAAFVRRDAPLERLTVVVQEVRNRLLPSKARHDLPARVLSERARYAPRSASGRPSSCPPRSAGSPLTSWRSTSPSWPSAPTPNRSSS